MKALLEAQLLSLLFLSSFPPLLFSPFLFYFDTVQRLLQGIPGIYQQHLSFVIEFCFHITKWFSRDVEFIC